MLQDFSNFKGTVYHPIFKSESEWRPWRWSVPIPIPTELVKPDIFDYSVYSSDNALYGSRLFQRFCTLCSLQFQWYDLQAKSMPLTMDANNLVEEWSISPQSWTLGFTLTFAVFYQRLLKSTDMNELENWESGCSRGLLYCRAKCVGFGRFSFTDDTPTPI